MGSIIFYPWIKLDESVQAGEYQITPWRRGDPTPQHWTQDEQQSIDTLLSSFMLGPRASIDTAAVVLGPDGRVLDDLDDNLARDFLEVNSLVTLSGLSARKFFRHSAYSNSSNFHPIIQNFQAPEGGLTIYSRRRDGTSTLIVPDRAHYPEYKADHISIHDVTPIDRVFLQALLEARGHNLYQRLAVAAPLFNMSNTDRIDTRERVETVLALSAFEALAGGWSLNKLVTLVSNALPIQQPVDPDSCERDLRGRFQKQASLRAVWMADFRTLRGNLAHGNTHDAYASIWTVHEHMLLAALVFPLVVKALLVDAGTYTLTQDDKVLIEATENLMSCENLFQKDDTEEFLWNKVMGDTLMFVTLQGL